MNPLSRRITHYSFKNILRNKLLSLGTIVVISVVVFFLNILEGAFFISNETIGKLNQKIDFNMELVDEVDVTSPLVQELVTELKDLGVDVEPVSKSKALETFEEMRPEFSSFRTKHNLTNPLPASLYLTGVGVGLFDDIRTVMEEPKYRDIVNYDINTSTFGLQEEKVGKWRQIITFVEQALHAMRFAFYLVAVLIIISTIRIIILSRQKEIDIMELVGAPYPVIQLPFVIEGIFYSLCGVVLGLVFYNFFLSGLYTQMLSGNIDQFLLSLLTSVHDHFTTQVFMIFAMQGLLFVAMGGMASYLAVIHFFVTQGWTRKRALRNA